MLPFFKQQTQASKQAKQADKAAEIAGQLGVSASVLIHRHAIALGKRIGKGAFGTVYRAEITGQDGAETHDCVAKQINVRHVKSPDLPLLRTELQVWSELDHPNCLKFFGCSLEPAEYLMMCEFMDGGSLADEHERHRAAKKAPPPLPVLVGRLKMIASALSHLHSRSIIHRDLKSANILLEKGSERVVVADFGLARYCAGASATEMTAETGSYRWMAPEVIRHENYHKPCDVYSFALVAWEMLTYTVPFADQSPVEAAMGVAVRSERPQIPAQCPKAIKGLLEACWAQEAAARPTVEQVLVTLGRAEAPEAEPARSTRSSVVDHASEIVASPTSTSPSTPTRSSMPRVSSKRKIADASGACSPKMPPMKRPDSISSGLTSMVRVTSNNAIHAS